MSKSIKEIEKELVSLHKQKEELEYMLTEIIETAMKRVAETQNIKRISEHIFMVKFSDMIHNPWSAVFYDWNKSISIIQKFLYSKPVSQWKDALQNKLNETPQNRPVIFKFSSGSSWYKTTQQIPVSYKFIQEIINQLNTPTP